MCMDSDGAAQCGLGSLGARLNSPTQLDSVFFVRFFCWSLCFQACLLEQRKIQLEDQVKQNTHLV